MTLKAKHALLLTQIASIAYASASVASRQSNSIEWGDCDKFSDSSSNSKHVQCAYFTVPLDWNNSTAGNGRIAVAKYAASGTKKGTLFTNPGGPGSSGVDDILTGGKQMVNITGGDYDIVGWDPRGVGSLTIPGEVSCYDSWDEYSEFWENTIFMPTFDVRGNFSDQGDIAAFYELADSMEAGFAKLKAQCDSKDGGQYMQYVGTAATVRDMVALADVLEPDTKQINYYGFSYGTMLGNMFVNMFPDRVGRVVLDGVMDPTFYSQGRPDKGWASDVESTDEAFQGFVNACETAGPELCTIADEAISGDMDLISWAQNLTEWAYDAHKEDPLTFYSAFDVRNTIFSAMYAPRTWADFANGDLIDLWSSFSMPDLLDDRRRKREISTRGEPGTTIHPMIRKRQYDEKPSNALEAITCGDSPDLTDVTTSEVFDEILRVTRDVSGFFGPLIPQPSHYCHLWPVRAVERFAGPFNNTLSNQILVIGNKADPITPFINAKVVADLLGDSAQLVEQNGFGHCSLAERSACMLKIISDYLVNGNLPTGDSTVCEVDDSALLFNDSYTGSSIDGDSDSGSDSDDDDDSDSGSGDSESGGDGALSLKTFGAASVASMFAVSLATLMS